MAPVAGLIRRALPTTAVALLAAAALVYVGWLLSVSRLWHLFLPEDWLIIVGRSDPSVATLLEPFNGHWLTLTIAAHQVMIRVFGLESNLPFLLAETGVHLACVATVTLLVRRYAGWVAGAASGLVLLTLGAAYEDLFWFMQVGFIGPTCLGLAAVGLADAVEWSRIRWTVIASLLIAGVMFSGVGLVMLGVIGLYLLGSRRVLVVAPAAAAYLLWATIWPSGYLLAGNGDPVSFAITVVTVLGDAFLGTGGPRAALVAVAIAAAAVALAAGWRPHRLTIAAAVGVVMIYVGVGIRGDWLPELAKPSRYVYPAVALVLVGLAPIIHPAPIGLRVAAATLFITVLLTNVSTLGRAAIGWERANLFFRAQTTAVEESGVSSAAMVEPIGLHAADYLGAISRFGVPERSTELEARLARPEMQAYADAMRRRIAESPAAGR
jgi:hypothetical protein